jgi:DMSO/TMAO reductase YedYZ molybdopterin-dependent catalytic subunit
MHTLLALEVSAVHASTCAAAAADPASSDAMAAAAAAACPHQQRSLQAKPCPAVWQRAPQWQLCQLEGVQQVAGHAAATHKVCASACAAEVKAVECH